MYDIMLALEIGDTLSFRTICVAYLILWVIMHACAVITLGLRAKLQLCKSHSPWPLAFFYGLLPQLLCYAMRVSRRHRGKWKTVFLIEDDGRGSTVIEVETLNYGFKRQKPV